MKINCEYCGIVVNNVTKRRRFCSRKCADAKKYQPSTKDRGGKWKECAYCGKLVWTPKCRLRFKNRFCNRNHHNLYDKKKAFNKKCVVCGKTFYCQPCQVRYRNRQACSMTCKGLLRTMKAVLNREIKGFTPHQIDRCIRYSKRAGEWREAIFKRDNYTCQSCGKRGGYLEAHHIKPFAFFPALRFELSNGQTLCKKCHNKTKISSRKMRKVYGQKTTKYTQK